MREQNFIERSYSEGTSSVYNALLKKVYLWMALALVVSGLVAAYIAQNPNMLQMVFSGTSFLILIVAEFALVWFLSARIMKMSFSTAGLMFIAYSVLNGATLSILFVAYTQESIATTFYITAGTFAATSLIGYTTKKDMSSFGNFFLMALVGLIIASVVNIFVASSTLYWIISYVGVLLFVGLTAYDTQKIKNMLTEYGVEDSEMTRKLALLGSLTLYLDFINLFIYLLRIFGRNND